MTHAQTNEQASRSTSSISRVLTCVSTLAVMASASLAQLTPDRTFYGIDRKMPMTVQAEGGDAEIKLINPADSSEVASAAALSGGVDLASLFPSLWTEKNPAVLFAQLSVDGAPIGAPVVLMPMISVDKAKIVNPQTLQPVQPGERGVAKFESDFARLRGQATRPVVYSGLRAYISQDAVLETSLGDIRIRLRPDVAPNHALNFHSLVEGGYYTDILFHRVVPSFVVQVGDPTGVGSGGPGYQIDLEKSSLPHDFGVLSMARTGDPDSGGSQIFICLTRQATAQLDGSYTAFGQAISGADTVKALGNVEVRGQKPIDPPVLNRAYLVDSAPFGTGPSPVTLPAATAADAPEEGER